MGHTPYYDDMKTRLLDLGFALERVGHHLDGPLDDRIKGTLRMRLRAFEQRRDALICELDALAAHRDDSDGERKADFDREWDRLWRDFDEEMGNLL